MFRVNLHVGRDEHIIWIVFCCDCLSGDGKVLQKDAANLTAIGNRHWIGKERTQQQKVCQQQCQKMADNNLKVALEKNHSRFTLLFTYTIHHVTMWCKESSAHKPTADLSQNIRAVQLVSLTIATHNAR